MNPSNEVYKRICNNVINAKTHNSDSLSFLHSIIKHCSYKDFVKDNDLESLQWLRKHDPSFDDSVISKYSVRYNRVAILEWLCSENEKVGNCDKHYEELCCVASEYGSIDALKYFIQTKNVKPKSIYCTVASLHGQLPTLMWLRSLEPPCPWDESTCEFACEDDTTLLVLKWLRTQEPPCPWNKTKCLEVATECGSKAIKKWLMTCDDL